MTSESTRWVRSRAAEMPVTRSVLPLRRRHRVGVFLTNLITSRGAPVCDQLVVVGHRSPAENDVPHTVVERVVCLHALAVRERRIVAVGRVVDPVRNAGVLRVVRGL